MIRGLRILAILIVIPTLYFLWFNAERDGVETLYFMLPDIVVCLGLIVAAARGGRQTLLVAYALACGVFMTATLGDYWTEGLAGVPPGAAIGVVVTTIAIALLMRKPTS